MARARRYQQTNSGSGWGGLSRLADQPFINSSGDGFRDPHGLVLALKSAFATVGLLRTKNPENSRLVLEQIPDELIRKTPLLC